MVKITKWESDLEMWQPTLRQLCIGHSQAGLLLKQVAITETDTRSCTSIDNDSWAAELLLHLHDLRLGLTGDRVPEMFE